MSLPPDYLARWTKVAEGACYFGQPLESYSREELLAIAAHGWHSLMTQQQEHLQELEMFRLFQETRERLR